LSAPRAVGPDTVVSLDIVMHDAQGALIHSSDAPMTYLHGGYGGVFEGIERAVEGKSVGETVRVQLEPEEAFGDYEAGLVRVEPTGRYGEGLQVGMEIEDSLDDDEEPRTYLVTDLAEGKVVLDGNHPLAGIALRFTCKVLSVRNATEEEIERGSTEEEGAR
jgi:FKBP-type peptidyl-prolyl cis-trans isomerase SlyD